MNIEKDFEKFVEEVELEEEFWVVIDTAKKGEVMAVSNDEKGARDSVKSSTTSKYDYHYGKDPKTLKVVKVKGKHSQKKAEKMIGTKLPEEIEKEAKLKKKKAKDGFAFGISRKKDNKRWGSGGYRDEEIEEDLNLIAVSEDMCDLKRGELSSDPMKAAWDKKCGGGEKKKKHTISTPSLRGVYDKAEFDPFIEEALGEGYKDLPPHLQKLVKKIEKKQKDWNKQNPNAKIKTLVYNPETGKPDIEVKENTMKLEDTVKQVLEGKKKKGEDPLTSKEPMKAYEDSDKDEPGTQGDMKKYQAARAKVLKKFGVKSCSELEGDEKKACYSALDAAHVSDDEEEKGEKKEEKIHSKFFTAIKSLMKNK